MTHIRTLCFISLLSALTSTKNLLAVPTVSATATLAVAGTEQFPGGTPDNGNLTVSMNGFTETIHYGQYSSPASLASGLAAMFCHDYVQFGLWAKAGANNNTDSTVITFQLTNGQAFGPINYTPNSTSFGFNSSGFTAVNPTPAPLAITGTSLPEGPPQMGFVIAGTGFGPSDNVPNTYVTLNGVELTTLSWDYNSVTVQLPSTTPLGSGNVVITVNGASSNQWSFKVDMPFGCSTN